MIFVIDPHWTDKIGIRKDDIVETCVFKLRQILEIAKKDDKKIIVPGDVTDSPYIAERIKTSLIELKKDYPDIDIYSSLGNHDLLQDNEDLTEETSFRVLEAAGVIKYSKKYDNELGIKNLDYTENIEKYVKENEKLPRIVCAHAFYDNLRFGGLDHNITQELAEEMAKKGVKHLVLGHDHKPYKVIEIKINNSKMFIHRPGNILRKKKRRYNLKRNINVLWIGKGYDYSYIPIEHKSFLEVISSEKLFELSKNDEALEVLEDAEGSESLEGLLSIMEAVISSEEESDDEIIRMINEDILDVNIKNKILEAIGKAG